MSQARKPNWGHVMAGLRRGVAVGNSAAMTDLAITINEGICDANGRVRDGATHRMPFAYCNGQSRAVMRTLLVRWVTRMTLDREYSVIKPLL